MVYRTQFDFRFLDCDLGSKTEGLRTRFNRETSTHATQVAVQNPAPLPQLQVGPGFRLRQSMEQAADVTVTPVPQTDDGRPLCLSYQLKGVCNSNCDGCHAHRKLSSHKKGVLIAWKLIFCAAQPPVSEISAPPWAPVGGSVGNTTLFTSSRRSQGNRGTQNRNTKTWYTLPPPTSAPTTDQKLKVID